MKWELKNQADGASADIYINDFIGDWIDDFFGFGITAKQFIDELQNLPDSVRTLRLHINSPGGDAMAAHHRPRVLNHYDRIVGDLRWLAGACDDRCRRPGGAFDFTFRSKVTNALISNITPDNLMAL